MKMQHKVRFLAQCLGESLITFIIRSEETFQVAEGKVWTGDREQKLSSVVSKEPSFGRRELWGAVGKEWVCLHYPGSWMSERPV